MGAVATDSNGKIIVTTIRRSLAVLSLTTALAIPNFALAQEGGVQTRQYDEGGLYKGTFQDGQQHGTGTYSLPNGFEYTGDWVMGEIKGQGVARYPDGAVYEGAFEQGKQHGFGKITYADGGTYEGDWENGIITGSGAAHYASGITYEG
ncbi:MAG: hypothetical protein ACJAX2_002291, partial [Celeribacter sp.]